jgi:uncharacterized membrane protein YgdD (TMEM256/DUF423 family)
MMRVLIVAGGLAGAAGVALSALSAHGGSPAEIAIAARFLLFHAPVFLALAALLKLELLVRHAVFGVGLLLGLGLVVFCSDMVLRVYRGHALFPLAAPTGGTMLILGWLGLAVAGMIARNFSQDARNFSQDARNSSQGARNSSQGD